MLMLTVSSSLLLDLVLCAPVTTPAEIAHYDNPLTRFRAKARSDTVGGARFDARVVVAAAADDVEPSTCRPSRTTASKRATSTGSRARGPTRRSVRKRSRRPVTSGRAALRWAGTTSF